jgi:hypothetical protein
MGNEEDYFKALQKALPAHLKDQARSLAQLLAVLEKDQNKTLNTKDISVSQEITSLLNQLAGKNIETTEATISFGQGNQLGDVTFRDTAGRDIINIHIPAPQQVSPDQLSGAQRSRSTFSSITVGLVGTVVLAALAYFASPSLFQMLRPNPSTAPAAPTTALSTATAQAAAANTAPPILTTAPPTVAAQAATAAPQISTSQPQAAASRDLVADQKFVGTLAKDATQEYSFQGRANVPLLFTVQGKGDLIYAVEILYPGGISQRREGNYGSSNTAQVAFTPLTDGVYTLRLLGLREFGDYMLSLRLIAAPDRPADRAIATMAIGESKKGALAINSVDTYSFQGQTNVPLLFTVQGKGNLIYAIEFFDPHGISQRREGNYGSSNTARVAFTPQADGVYTLRLLGIREFGDYTLSLSTP